MGIAWKSRSRKTVCVQPLSNEGAVFQWGGIFNWDAWR